MSEEPPPVPGQNPPPQPCIVEPVSEEVAEKEPEVTEDSLDENEA